MKTKTILFLLLTLVLTFSAIIPAFAQAVPERTAAEAGKVVTVEFKYEGITGINGTFTCSNKDMISDIQMDTDNYLVTFNENTGVFMYHGSQEIDFVITLNITIADTAKIGDECVIQFEYEIPDAEAGLPSIPEYSYDKITLYIIDYSELEAQIARTANLVEDEYTTESWAIMKDALDKAESLLGNATTQDEITNAVTALKDAIDALEKKPVVIPLDYTELNNQIARTEGLVEEEYTTETWAPMADALAAAKALVNNATTQDEITNAATALKNAIDALEKKPVVTPLNYDELNTQIKDAESKDEDKYTTESWAAMIVALGSARSALTDAKTQEEVDAAAKVLKDAIAALVEKPVVTPLDYTELNNQIARTEGLVADDYTAETWGPMADALAAAKSLVNNATTQEEITNAATALKNAIDALEKKPVVKPLDYTALDKIIAEAESKEKDKYTEESWNKMIEELANARATRENATTQEEINNATAALTQSVSALKLNDNETGDSSVMLILSIVVLVVATASLVYSKKRFTVR